MPLLQPFSPWLCVQICPNRLRRTEQRRFRRQLRFHLIANLLSRHFQILLDSPALIQKIKQGQEDESRRELERQLHQRAFQKDEGRSRSETDQLPDLRENRADRPERDR